MFHLITKTGVWKERSFIDRTVDIKQKSVDNVMSRQETKEAFSSELRIRSLMHHPRLVQVRNLIYSAVNFVTKLITKFFKYIIIDNRLSYFNIVT